MKKFLREFKEFAVRGNVLDMAVGVVIGGAFSKIVSSLVADLVMPLLSILTGRVNLSSLAWILPSPVEGGDPITVTYGVFLQTLLDFILIAFSIFVVIKLINRLHKKKEEPSPAPEEPKPSKEEILLAEIRDLLKAQQPDSETEKKVEE